MRQVQAASSAGAATGVIAAAFMAILGGPAAVIPPADVDAQPEDNLLDLEKISDIAGAAAWKACVDSSRSVPIGSTVNSWAARLAPVLTASIGLVGSLGPHFVGAPHWQTACVLGGLGVIVFALMIGVAAVPFTNSMRPETVSRHATFVAFIITMVLFVSGLCYILREDKRFAIPAGAIGSAAVLLLLLLWYRSKNYK